MSKTITITQDDLIHTAKLYYKIPDLIDKFLTRQIIEQATQEAGITIETEELQQYADNFRLINKLQSADYTWQWLAKYSLSVDDFEELILINLLANKLVEHLFLDKIEPYFFENQLDYLEVIMYEIVLEDEDLALELFYVIQQKEMSFYEVAHHYITDIELRRKCGYLGTVSRKELKPEISAAVFAANYPQLLKPIITSKGVHLILVEEIIKPELNEKLRQKITTDLLTDWLQKQIEQIEVIITTK